MLRGFASELRRRRFAAKSPERYSHPLRAGFVSAPLAPAPIFALILTRQGRGLCGPRPQPV